MEDQRLKRLIAIARRERDTSGLAAAAGTTKMTLSRWARGEGRPPSRAHARGLARWAARNVSGADAESALSWLNGGDCPVLDAAGVAAEAVGSLRCLRQAIGITQGVAADRAGVSRATWNAWETKDDRGELSADRFRRASAAVRDPGAGNVSRR